MSTQRNKGPMACSVPDIIIDQKKGKRYLKGKFLGKGGFAKCFELIDSETQEIFAGKVVSKSQLVKPSQKEKMTQEINIQRSLNHRHIVGFHGYFEDNDNIYILLELCRRRSLMELHKRRKYVTEMEARYFIQQIVRGCIYLHENKVIHRDLKLANLFMNDDLEVKIGDFGLATRIDFDGERKKTLCGTPNYIAPEVLAKRGHSYEVDVWSLGCIVYTLLVGRPPFETSSLKDTYSKIRRNEYLIPNQISSHAGAFIRELLRAEPCQRPNMHSIANHPFFTGYIPKMLPVSCLTTAPRLDNLVGGAGEAGHNAGRRPLGEINAPATAGRYSGYEPEAGGVATAAENDLSTPKDAWISELFKQISGLFANRKVRCLEVDGFTGMEEAEDPASSPVFWVSKWVDYSDKYGLGYQLNDNSYGVLFNDTSRLLLTSNEQNLQYIEKNGTEHLHTIKNHPDWLYKKVTLLDYFKSYMTEHLLKAGANMPAREADEMVRLPFLRTWFRTRSAIVLHLSNGTLQLNFFDDHTKIILCPLMNAVTVITAEREFKTFRLSSLEKYGICRDLLSRLHYALTMMDRILSQHSSSSKVKLSVK